MAIEGASQNASIRVPPGHPSVVVEHLVQRQGEIPIGSLLQIIEATCRPVGIQHLAKHLHAGTVAKELPGREEVSPSRHAILDRAVVGADFREPLARHVVECLPLRELRSQPRGNLGGVVVRGRRRSVAAHPLPALPARLRLVLYPLLEHDRVELVTHASTPRLCLNLVPIDHAPAVVVGARTRSAGDSAVRLLRLGADYFEGALSIR